MTSLLICSMLAVIAAEPSEATLTTLDGRTHSGRVESWNGEDLFLRTSEGTEAFAVAELLDLRLPGDAPQSVAATSIELVDGTRIEFSQFSVAGGVATVASSYSERLLRIPTEKIKLVELQPPMDSLEAAFREFERNQLAGDALFIVKREGASVDYIAGAVGDVTAEQAEFEWDGEHVPVKRTKIAAIAYYHSRTDSPPETVCELTLSNGSRIAATRVSLNDGRLRVETPAGLSLTIPLSEVTHADFSSGKIAYLSDLTPVEVRWTPRIGAPTRAEEMPAWGRPKRDVSFTGSPLSLVWKDDVSRSRRDVRVYAKGIAVRSRTEVVYRLPPGMTAFVATAGIDPLTANEGHLLLQIRGDDRVLWEGVIDGKQPPVELEVELHAARRLQILVDYGDNLDYGDRLHLVEAQVRK